MANDDKIKTLKLYDKKYKRNDSEIERKMGTLFSI
jgi:hypothetical protein